VPEGNVTVMHAGKIAAWTVGIDYFGSTRSYMYSCKNSEKEVFTWGSAPVPRPGLNQVSLGQRSRTRKGDLEAVRGRDDC